MDIFKALECDKDIPQLKAHYIDDPPITHQKRLFDLFCNSVRRKQRCLLVNPIVQEFNGEMFKTPLYYNGREIYGVYKNKLYTCKLECLESTGNSQKTESSDSMRKTKTIYLPISSGKTQPQTPPRSSSASSSRKSKKTPSAT